MRVPSRELRRRVVVRRQCDDQRRGHEDEEHGHRSVGRVLGETLSHGQTLIAIALRVRIKIRPRRTAVTAVSGRVVEPFH